jgi:hypothetical protein
MSMPAAAVVSTSANGATSLVGSLDVVTVRSPGAGGAGPIIGPGGTPTPSPSPSGSTGMMQPGGSGTVSNIGGDPPMTSPPLSAEGIRGILGEQAKGAGDAQGPLRVFILDGGLRAPDITLAEQP